MREVYQSIEVLESRHEDEDWKMIWSMHVSERCQSFVLMIKHDRLLTNLSKSMKGIGPASCKLYGNACENTLYYISDCVKAMHI